MAPSWTTDDYEAWQRRAAHVPKPIAPVKPEPMKLQPTTDEDKLNKTEKAYLAFIRTMNYSWYGIQSLTLKLAHDCRLTPDFAVMTNEGMLRLIDVKGFQREDALIKMKVAARMFPWIEFVIVKKEAGGWSHQKVNP